MQEACEGINESIPQEVQTVAAISYIPTPAECATMQTPPAPATQQQQTEGQTFFFF